jgi:hypothetical protein
VRWFASDRALRFTAALFQGGHGGRAAVARIQRPGGRCAHGLGHGSPRGFHVRLIGGMGGPRVGHPQPTGWVRRDVGMVMWVKASVVAVFHEARVGIGAVVLSPVTWPRLGWRGLRPTRLTRARCFCPRPPFRLRLGAFGLVAFRCAGFPHRLGLGPGGQSRLASGPLIGADAPIGPAHLRRLLAQREPLVDLGAPLVCEFQQTLVTHGVAWGRVGVTRGAVQADVAQLQHVGRWRPHPDLHPQLFDFGPTHRANVGDRVMVGRPVASSEATGEGLVRRLVDQPRPAHTGGVPIAQQPQQQFRGERVAPACALAGRQAAHIPWRAHVRHDARPVVWGQRFAQTHRPVARGVVINGCQGSAHAHSVSRRSLAHAGFSPTDC